VSILPANIQDRDGARALLHEARRRFPFVERIFADAGYQGPKMANVVASSGRWKINIVKRSDLHRFVVLPKRWIVTARTMLPVWALSGRRLSNAGAGDGDRCCLRRMAIGQRVNLSQANQSHRKV
jgi:putative transposase